MSSGSSQIVLIDADSATLPPLPPHHGQHATLAQRINAALRSAPVSSTVVVRGGDGLLLDEPLRLGRSGVSLAFEGVARFRVRLHSHSHSHSHSHNNKEEQATVLSLFAFAPGVAHVTVRGAGAGTATRAVPTNPAPLTVFEWQDDDHDDDDGGEKDSGGVGVNAAYVALLEDVAYVTLAGMRFVGRGREGPPSGGILGRVRACSSLQGIVLEGLFLADMSRTLIALEHPLMCSVSQVRLTRGAASGLLLSAGTSNVLRSVYVSAMARAGILLQGVSYTTLLSCAAESSGVAFELRRTRGVSLVSCGAEEPTWRSEAFPGTALRVEDGAASTSVHGFYATLGADGRPALQPVIEIGAHALGVELLHPVLRHATRVAVHVAASARGVRLVTDSSNVALAESGATERLLVNESPDLTLLYDGYSVCYGGQGGPVLRDTSGALCTLVINARDGSVSSRPWPHPPPPSHR